MRTEMSKAEAITRIDRFLAYLEKIYTPQCNCEEALIRKDDITAFVIARDALKEQRPHGEWIKHIDDLFPVESTEECSVCHEEQRITGNDDNFCPNCGADMRKEGDEK